jgi:hypothetical protein
MKLLEIIDTEFKSRQMKTPPTIQDKKGAFASRKEDPTDSHIYIKDAGF